MAMNSSQNVQLSEIRNTMDNLAQEIKDLKVENEESGRGQYFWLVCYLIFECQP
jgi:hypothetical protein